MRWVYCFVHNLCYFQIFGEFPALNYGIFRVVLVWTQKLGLCAIVSVLRKFKNYENVNYHHVHGKFSNLINFFQKDNLKNPLRSRPTENNTKKFFLMADHDYIITKTGNMWVWCQCLDQNGPARTSPRHRTDGFSIQKRLK